MSLRHQVYRRLPAGLRRGIRKAYYPRVLRRFNEADWPFAPLMRKLIDPGDTVVDAGANIGYLSRLLAGMVGDGGKVVSFEPVPLTFALLENNMKRLRLENVQAVHAGLSAQPGRGSIRVPEYEDGGENLYESRLVNADDAAATDCEVRLESLDHFFGAEQSISLIKIDVEGHEEAVIRGAGALLDRCKPALLIEVEGRLHEAGTPAGRMHAALEDLGYSAYIWFEEQLIPWEAPATAIDFLYLQPAHVARAE